jgi:hypothetical protein
MAEQRGVLPLCEKATHAIHSSTWRIWGESLPPSAQVRGDQQCAGNDGGLEFLCFVVGSTANGEVRTEYWNRKSVAD